MAELFPKYFASALSLSLSIHSSFEIYVWVFNISVSIVYNRSQNLMLALFSSFQVWNWSTNIKIFTTNFLLWIQQYCYDFTLILWFTVVKNTHWLTQDWSQIKTATSRVCVNSIYRRSKTPRILFSRKICQSCSRCLFFYVRLHVLLRRMFASCILVAVYVWICFSLYSNFCRQSFNMLLLLL